MIIKQIDAKDTYQLRKEVLRPHHSLEQCKFPGDNLEDTFHLGAFVEEELVSIASFFLENNSRFEDFFQYRLRGMATKENFRRKGLSQALLQSAFPLIKQNNVTLLWCNARVSAQGFYEKVGFVAESDVFEIDDIGPHILMSWRPQTTNA